MVAHIFKSPVASPVAHIDVVDLPASPVAHILGHVAAPAK